MGTEQVAVFGASTPLVGVVSDPATGTNGRLPCVIIFDAGPTYRVGPSRQTVRIARRLSSLGFVSVRFDHSGVGDSGAARDSLPFQESSVLETQSVMDQVAASHGIDSFVLIGLCSGAITAFRTALADRRVVGAVMMNPVMTDNPEWNQRAIARKMMRDYNKVLVRPGSWWRAVTGRSNYGRFLSIVRSWFQHVRRGSKAVSSVSNQLRSEIMELLNRGVHLLTVQSKGDASEESHRMILGRDKDGLVSKARLQRERIVNSDHVFTLQVNQRDVVQVLEEWISVFRR